MSTKHDAKHPGKPAGGAPHDLIDDHSGVYGWFRRHQKKLLYSVGLFVLLTFSVSGAMVAFFEDLFRDEARDLPTIQVGGLPRTGLTAEDLQWGSRLANRASVLGTVLPGIDPGEGGRNDLGESYAILRCAALTLGLGVSLDEVDRALDKIQAESSATSLSQLAGNWNFASAAELQLVFAEAMRIGTLLRLQTLGLDNSEASILERIIADREKITLRAAVFDEKALEEELKKQAGVTKEALETWLAAKSKPEQKRFDVFGPNKVALTLGALLFAGYDRSEWAAQLEGFTVGDEQLQRIYKVERERFKNADESYRDLTDEAVKAELTTLLETERILQDLQRQITEKTNEACKEANDERQGSMNRYFETKNKVAELEKKVAEGGEGLAAVQDELRTQQEALVQFETQRDAAQKAYDDKFAAFDFAAAFTELTAGKKGIVLRSFTDPREAKDLKDLDANEFGLGTWAASSNAAYHNHKGMLSFGPQRTDKAAFLYQVTDLVIDELKPWAELQPVLEGAYYTEQAKEQAEAAKAKFADALLRLAKAKVPDEVAKIEQSRQARIDEKVGAWETTTKADIEAAKARLADPKMGKQARATWQARQQSLEQQLAGREAKVAAISKEVDAELEQEIGELAKKQHKDVLAEAAAEAGFTLVDIPPLPRDLQNKPRFDKRYDATTVYLFRNHDKLDEGEATGVVQDVTARRWIAAYCTKVEPLTIADVERREFELWRTGFGGNSSYAALQERFAYQQAFNLDALKQRYAYENAVVEQREVTPGTPPEGNK